MHEYDHHPPHAIIENLYFVVFGSVKWKRGLAYHEVIWGRPLFGLPPHAGKKNKKKTHIVGINPATIQTVL